MYVIVFVALDGNEYEVGADVSYDPGDMYQGPSHEVGEPDISAPNCRLKDSRIVDESTLPDGWSEEVEAALIAEHEARVGDAEDARADYKYDCWREEKDQ